MMRKYLLSLFAFFLFSGYLFSQTTITGTVTDPDGVGVISAFVVLKKGGNEIKTVATDFDGNYIFTNIDGGNYDIEASNIEFATQEIKGIVVNDGATTKVDIKMSGNVMDEVIILGYKVPLIDFDNTSSQKTVTAEGIRNLGVKSVNAVVSTTSGLSTQSGSDAVSIRGSRSNATNYYVDGLRVTGLIPVSEIEQMQVITGGLGAQYGDVTGGVISLTSKGPSSKFSGAVEAETSEFLDAFGYNFANVSLSGPIIKRKATETEPESTILGFRVAAQYLYQLDDRPSAVGVYRMDQATIKDLEDNPIYLSGGTPLARAELLTSEDLPAPLKTTPNEDNTDIDITGKLDARINEKIDVSLSGVYGIQKDRFTPGGGFGLLNWTRNPYENTNNYRINARWRHRVGKQGSVEEVEGEEPSGATVIRNASYTLQFGTESTSGLRQDIKHEDNFFAYGQYGTKAGSAIPLVANVLEPDEWNGIGLLCFFEGFCVDHNTYIEDFDDLIGLVNSNGELMDSPNPTLAQYQEFNGTLTGTNNDVWGNRFFDNVGRVYNNYRKYQNDRRTFNFDAQFDLLPNGNIKSRHNIRFGAIYETRTNRNYSINPAALWNLAKDAANSHFVGTSVDTTTFTGDSITYFFDGVPFEFAEYGRLIEENSNNLFYKSIRDQLGLGLNDYVNIDGPEIDASKLSLDMFSAGEVVNWNDLGLDYYGFDYLGNPVDGVSFDDFFTDSLPDGRRTYPVAAAQPTYISGYIQDKFSYKDIILRVGLRAEYFDANTKVAKDPYSLYAIESAQEFEARTGVELPSSVGEDYKVYVESEESNDIQAFRSGDQWYDRNGTATSGALLFQGPAIPSYKFGDTENNIRSRTFNPDNSFEDYTPTFNLAPRISLSFPISESAGFFAHYDELIQRPPSNTIFTALDYYFFEDPSRLNPGGAPANNPNLKPEKTIDYEVGFQQKLTNSTAIKLSAYYRENRDMIQARYYNFVSITTGRYQTYGNIDFGTVKGFTATYDFRRTKNIEFNVSYSLQYAEGTGSSANSGLNSPNGDIVRVLIPLSFDERHRIVGNIDYRYEQGDRYTGPSIQGVDIFANTGLNIQTAAVSGRPYTRLSSANNPFGGAGSTGDINGARLPWNFNIDARLDKTFQLFGKAEGRKGIYLNVYLRASNLLNTKNVINVYQVTGSPDDDGYINSFYGQEALKSIESDGKSVESFLSAYEWGLLNPGFYALPRRLYVGAIVEF